MLNTPLLTVVKTFTICYNENLSPLKNIKIQQKKNEYEYLYEKDDELKGDKTTDENEGIIEFGNDFINCKIFSAWIQ